MECFFVRGLSRSGGTLMATILDAHPDVSMSYETYEHLLMPTDKNEYDILEVLKKKNKNPLRVIHNYLFSGSKKYDSNFQKFVARAGRSEIDLKVIENLIVEHFKQGLKFDTFKERMLFVQRLAMEKMYREGKKYWGAKIASIYDDLYKLYPDAKFLFMLRDGRDIAASRKLVGNFIKPVEKIAESWCNQIEIFQRFSERDEIQAMFVPYESLVKDPEREMHKLIDFMELPWSNRVLGHHKLNLSIHRNPAGHLSGEQVKSPINTASIGRWKRDLTLDEIARFEAKAGPLLKKLGYE